MKLATLLTALSLYTGMTINTIANTTTTQPATTATATATDHAVSAAKCDKVRNSCANGNTAANECVEKLTACQDMKVKENMEKNKIDVDTSNAT